MGTLSPRYSVQHPRVHIGGKRKSRKIRVNLVSIDQRTAINTLVEKLTKLKNTSTLNVLGLRLDAIHDEYIAFNRAFHRHIS